MIREHLALAVLGAVLVAGCGSRGGVSGRGNAAAPVAPAPPVSPAPAPAPGAAMAVERTVTMDEYSFEPEELVVPLGAAIKLTVVNSGHTRHDFNILSPYNIEGDLLPSGASQVLTFTADKPGRFQIVCSQKNHKAEGMVGYLVVQ